MLRVGAIEDAGTHRLVVGVNGLLDRLVGRVVRQDGRWCIGRLLGGWGGRLTDRRIRRRHRGIAVSITLAASWGAAGLRALARTRGTRGRVARV